MFPDQGPEPAAPRLADEDVAAVAVGEAAQAVVAAGALVLAKAGRRAVGVRVSALERGRSGGPCARERRVGAVLQKVYTFNAYRPTDWRFVAEPVVWLGWRTHTRLTMRLSPCGGDAWQMTIDVDSMDLRPNSTDTMLKVLAGNVTGRFGGGPPPMKGS